MTDRLAKISKNKDRKGKVFSVQHMISCSILKRQYDGCNGSSVEAAWNKLSQSRINSPAG